MTCSLFFRSQDEGLTPSISSAKIFSLWGLYSQHYHKPDRCMLEIVKAKDGIRAKCEGHFADQIHLRQGEEAMFVANL